MFINTIKVGMFCAASILSVSCTPFASTTFKAPDYYVKNDIVQQKDFGRQHSVSGLPLKVKADTLNSKLKAYPKRYYLER